jgi:hypothetical protein
MKNTLMVLALAASIAACNNNPKTGTEISKDVVTVDTTGLYNDQGKVLDINGAKDTVITTVTTTTITKPGNGEALVADDKPAVTPRKATPAKRRTTSTASGSGTRNSGTVASRSGTSTQPAAQTQKKGWSKAAKGTAIGAGSGAVVGAIISKKKGRGAIIGGVVGAGVGYGVGRSKDKKDGRY